MFQSVSQRQRGVAKRKSGLSSRQPAIEMLEHRQMLSVFPLLNIQQAKNADGQFEVSPSVAIMLSTSSCKRLRTAAGATGRLSAV